jgi:hypothetical protein
MIIASMSTFLKVYVEHLFGETLSDVIRFLSFQTHGEIRQIQREQSSQEVLEAYQA